MIAAIRAILAPVYSAAGSFANGLVTVFVSGLCLCPCCAALCLAISAVNTGEWAQSHSPAVVAGAEASTTRATAFAARSTASVRTTAAHQAGVLTVSVRAPSISRLVSLATPGSGLVASAGSVVTDTVPANLLPGSVLHQLAPSGN